MRVSLPPLRERPGDIPLLIDYFLKTIADTEGSKAKSILEDAQAALADYAWPGNVRELENVLRRTIVMAKGDAIRTDASRGGNAQAALLILARVRISLSLFDVFYRNETNALPIPINDNQFFDTMLVQ